jgi:hypothetical protein
MPVQFWNNGTQAQAKTHDTYLKKTEGGESHIARETADESYQNKNSSVDQKLRGDIQIKINNDECKSLENYK